MTIIPPTIISRTIFEFKDGGTTVTMSRPVVDDTKTQQLVRINRNTRGLTRRIFSDSNWYKAIIYDYSFRNLTLAKKDELVAFLQARVGSLITVIDHLTISKTVHVVDVAPIEEKRNDECSYTVGVIVQDII